MGKSLQDLGLKDEPLPTAGQDLEGLPQFGGFAPPPHPGPYRFKLPQDLSALWDVFDTTDKGQRVQIQFDQEHPLVITQSPGGRANGDTFQTRLNNSERPRGKDKVLASDLDYLIAAFEPKTKRPGSNRAYVEKVRTFGGREFAATIRWSWRCSKTRNIRVKDAQGAYVEVQNRTGCGEVAYEEDMAKAKTADGQFPLEIQCTCGAIVRAFGNIDNLKA